MNLEIENLRERLKKYSRWNGECLESTLTSSRYAFIKFKGIPIGAHRASWLVHFGEIPKGFFVCHHCDNPKCIKPDHLFLGIPKDNMDDMKSKKRENYWGKTKYNFEKVEIAFSLRKKGITHKEIAEKLQIPMGTLNSFFRRTSKQKDAKEFYAIPKYSQEIREKAFQMTQQGIKCKDVQNILGIPKRSLTRILNKFKVKSAEERPR